MNRIVLIILVVWFTVGFILTIYIFKIPQRERRKPSNILNYATVSLMIISYTLSLSYLIKPLNKAVALAPSTKFKQQRRSIIIQFIMIQLSMIFFLIFSIIFSVTKLPDFTKAICNF